jgi:hypothetical protein
MGMEINWRPQALVSALHAAEAAARNQPIVDGRLGEAIAEPAMQLAAEIRSANLPSVRFWGHLIPLAANIAGRRQFVETAVTKTVGRGARLEATVGSLDARVAGVDAAVRGALPHLSEELALRERPIREQWEARGAGMMQEIGRLTDPDLIVECCDVMLIHPALGGGGEAHLSYNSVRFEAVLANPVAELPEAIRLAWLIAQLHHSDADRCGIGRAVAVCSERSGPRSCRLAVKRASGRRWRRANSRLVANLCRCAAAVERSAGGARSDVWVSGVSGEW